MTSTELIEKANERYKELEYKGWEWRSFYNGFLEGATSFGKQDSRWLIETKLGVGTVWMTNGCKGDAGWTTAADKAIAFCDQQSALFVLALLGLDDAYVTEHIFQ